MNSLNIVQKSVSIYLDGETFHPLTFRKSLFAHSCDPTAKKENMQIPGILFSAALIQKILKVGEADVSYHRCGQAILVCDNKHGLHI